LPSTIILFCTPNFSFLSSQQTTSPFIQHLNQLAFLPLPCLPSYFSLSSCFPCPSFYLFVLSTNHLS
jgi:hypothetical protein